MNRKTIFSILTVLGIFAMAACSTTTGTPTTILANTENTAVPTVISNSTDTNSGTAPTESPNDVTSMDSNLACGGEKASASTTMELTEGPYYTPGSPENASLYEDGMAGTKLILTGYVFDTNCQPVANAWLDFWQADSSGKYDNSGYTLRGHQYTDANGHFELITVVPGIYPGRTEHIHFKVQAPNGKVITSQLFFPGVTQNDSDGIYDDSLLISIQETGDGLLGQYNFVVP